MVEKNLDFDFYNEKGEKVSLSDYRGKNLVIYFYPKDLTHGCTKEAKEFTDLKREFEDENTVVLGISRDDYESHREFINREDLEIDLISDKDEKAHKFFNVLKFKTSEIKDKLSEEWKELSQEASEEWKDFKEDFKEELEEFREGYEEGKEKGDRISKDLGKEALKVKDIVEDKLEDSYLEFAIMKDEIVDKLEDTYLEYEIEKDEMKKKYKKEVADLKDEYLDDREDYEKELEKIYTKAEDEFKDLKKKYNSKNKYVERSTFVFDKDGNLVKEYRDVKPEGHAEKVLHFIKNEL